MRWTPGRRPAAAQFRACRERWLVIGCACVVLKGELSAFAEVMPVGPVGRSRYSVVGPSASQVAGSRRRDTTFESNWSSHDRPGVSGGFFPKTGALPPTGAQIDGEIRLGGPSFFTAVTDLRYGRLARLVHTSDTGRFSQAFRSDRSEPGGISLAAGLRVPAFPLREPPVTAPSDVGAPNTTHYSQEAGT